MLFDLELDDIDCKENIRHVLNGLKEEGWGLIWLPSLQSFARPSRPRECLGLYNLLQYSKAYLVYRAVFLYPLGFYSR